MTRTMLDQCMYAGTADNEHITVFGDEGRLESPLPALTLRRGRCADRGTHKVWGERSGSGKGVSLRRVWNMNIKYAGQQFGASCIQHQRFAHALRKGLAAEVTLEEGLRGVATGLAGHRNVDIGQAVAMRDVLPAGS